jgi:hypothetical protein
VGDVEEIAGNEEDGTPPADAAALEFGVRGLPMLPLEPDKGVPGGESDEVTSSDDS